MAEQFLQSLTVTLKQYLSLDTGQYMTHFLKDHTNGQRCRLNDYLGISHRLDYQEHMKRNTY